MAQVSTLYIGLLHVYGYTIATRLSISEVNLCTFMYTAVS